MKLLLLITFAAAICYAKADKSHRLLAAIMAGMNGGMANGVIPIRMAGGLNPPMVAVGGAGFAAQPQFAQFVPGATAYIVPVPVSSAYTLPAGNNVPFIGGPNIPPMNPPQQPLMGIAGGTMQQQLVPLSDSFRRFRRQIRKLGNTLTTTVDTQIPAPTETLAPTACNKEGHHEDNKSVTNSL
ncbi:secretory calcium-binding phosphoprotein 9 [Xyrichtys novacula]|uniref:Secretory calcium-binding phosphoprotein 9 n=1 Tax=Xyrichtys novacula TaxID=13765 RepID=A0AAV1ETV4_XYRNO|nr:secretory calcium-binding phosphoprotein 9 [Xyrichtys novacula]